VGVLPKDTHASSCATEAVTTGVLGRDEVLDRSPRPDGVVDAE